MSKKMNRITTATLAGVMLLASGAATAKGAYDGSSNLVCAAFDVMACVDGITCRRGEARTFDMPEFMTIDFKKKSIRAIYDGDKEANSPIKNMEKTGNQLVLQGVENNHGWSAAIHMETGRLSIASVGDEVTFSIFGACKAY